MSMFTTSVRVCVASAEKWDDFAENFKVKSRKRYSDILPNRGKHICIVFVVMLTDKTAKP